jgi:hypothetical protein
MCRWIERRPLAMQHQEVYQREDFWHAFLAREHEACWVIRDHMDFMPDDDPPGSEKEVIYDEEEEEEEEDEDEEEEMGDMPPADVKPEDVVPDNYD